MPAAQMIMEEEEETTSQPRTRQAAINRDRKGVHARLVVDYFANGPVYMTAMFRRQFRMSRWLFLRIADDLVRSDPFFTFRYNARGQRGFTTLEKCTTVIRQLVYGTTHDSLDEYLRMSKRTTRECLYKFCEWVVKLYSKKYLWKPNRNDVQKLYQAYEERHGFQVMLGSIDCMHLPWQNCPTAW
ncbi:uncharacterized protein LOC110907158 [Helianthus annuus]|uniref:uncharacterized protein LOC110907158 n=1 Tax=Helianthus annuus TaxID=4232 RepID=UPI000B8FDB36|nr:uncharacterized protein LOC110907158 [Helianthus annuus]